MPLLRLAFLAALASGVGFAAPDEKKPTPKFKLAKGTEYEKDASIVQRLEQYKKAVNK